MSTRYLLAFVALLAFTVGGVWHLSDVQADQHGEGKESCSARKAGCCGTCGGEDKACPSEGKGHGKEHCDKQAKACGEKSDCDADKECHRGKAHRHGARDGHVQKALAHLDKAQQALDSGDHEALEEHIAQARQILEDHHQMMLAAQPAVNSSCPFMGREIDPENVPASLTRYHNGRKIGFCCGGCPKQWDRLSDEQKDSKLQEMMDTASAANQG